VRGEGPPGVWCEITCSTGCAINQHPEPPRSVTVTGAWRVIFEAYPRIKLQDHPNTESHQHSGTMATSAAAESAEVAVHSDSEPGHAAVWTDQIGVIVEHLCNMSECLLSVCYDFIHGRDSPHTHPCLPPPLHGMASPARCCIVVYAPHEAKRTCVVGGGVVKEEVEGREGSGV
jgi:hypothetical protein